MSCEKAAAFRFGRRWHPSLSWAGAALVGLVLCSCSVSPKDPDPGSGLAAASQAAAAKPGEFQPFSFVHISDPHLGFVRAADARFAQQVSQINAMKPDFVVLTGDLTYGLTDRHMAVIDSALKRFQVPVKLIPGNHDVRDAESLALYRRKYGDDYYLFTHNGCDFIFLDTAILDLDSPWYFGKDERFRQEVNRQWAWLEKTLADSRQAQPRHIFLLLHIPPFVNTQDERGLFTCLSRLCREPLLALADKYGVKVILAGHIHRTIEVQAGRCAIYTVGGTYWPIDNRGYGCRVLTVDKDRIGQQYVRLPGK
jgi:predicted MPP superfamily phosphohydrolase